MDGEEKRAPPSSNLYVGVTLSILPRPLGESLNRRSSPVATARVLSSVLLAAGVRGGTRRKLLRCQSLKKTPFAYPKICLLLCIMWKLTAAQLPPHKPWEISSIMPRFKMFKVHTMLSILRQTLVPCAHTGCILRPLAAPSLAAVDRRQLFACERFTTSEYMAIISFLIVPRGTFLKTC